MKGGDKHLQWLGPVGGAVWGAQAAGTQLQAHPPPRRRCRAARHARPPAQSAKPGAIRHSTYGESQPRLFLSGCMPSGTLSS